MAPYTAEEFLEKYRELLSWDAVAAYFGVSRSTVSRRIKEAGGRRFYMFSPILK